MARSRLSAQLSTGLSKSRMKSGGGGNNQRVRLDDSKPVILQFVSDPDGDGFTEFDQHQFQEDGKWKFVPCTGKRCPLCADDDGTKNRRYRFVAQVYNLKEKKMQVLEGPKDLATRIFSKYERRPGVFLKRVFEVTRLPTSPVSYEVDTADEDRINLRTKGEPVELQKYLDGEVARYFGDDEDGSSRKHSGRSSLDAPDDDDEDDRPRRRKSGDSGRARSTRSSSTRSSASRRRSSRR